MPRRAAGGPVPSARSCGAWSFQLAGTQLGITITSLVSGFSRNRRWVSLLEPVVEPLVGERAVHGVSLASRSVW